MRLGVDTGGTFTDLVWLDAAGRLQIHKELSTPQDPAVSILAGIARLAVPEAAAVVHGSTVATNALLERRGARTALITTAGFADVLAIGRQNRPVLYALVPQKPAPLVPRRWRFEVPERVTAGGDIQQALDPTSLDPILTRLRTEAIESVAVSLLFSFLRPEHEQLIAERLRGLRPQPPFISLSSEILPEYREYERTVTTVINAYVAPLMSRYLERLAAGVAPRPLTVMQSNGGIISAARAGHEAARTCLSGPAGGVVGARFVAQLAGFDEIISFDMGGTSTDVALCPGRLPATTRGAIVGLPLRLPLIDIHTVGAGGGSLAQIDPGGALQVGPQSAGADPGPAAYGRGGRQATTTDANLLTGRLDADHFLGGSMALDRTAAYEALARLATEMGATSPQAAAWAVLQVANATMERAIRQVSVERGHDPRRFTLVAFGGAGPLHACDLARALGLPRVLVPAVPGVLSALGMLCAAPTRDYSQTVMLEAEAATTAADLAPHFAALRRRAEPDLAGEGHHPDDLRWETAADMRYRGQSHELTVALPSAEFSLVDLLHEAHETRYGYRQPEATVEVVTVRLTVTAPVRPPVLIRESPGPTDARAAMIGEKPVWFDGRPVPSRLFRRDQLQAGQRFAGPAVVVQYDTTTVVPPAWRAIVDPWRNLILSRADSQE